MNARKLLAQVVLGTGATVIYTPPTSPPNSQGNVISMFVCNTSNAARTFTLRLVNIVTSTVAHSFYEAKALAANDTLDKEANEILFIVPAGYRVEGLASVADVNVLLFGDEIT